MEKKEKKKNGLISFIKSAKGGGSGLLSTKVKLILLLIGFILLLILLVVISFFFEFDSLSAPITGNGEYAKYEKGKGICNLIVPLKAHYTISSLYGYRVAKAQNGSAFHRGIDMAVASGTDVYAAISGTVTVGNSTMGGHYLRIKSESGEVVKYYHLSKTIATSGQKVNQGDLVAKSGNTGASSGPHLHFEFADETGNTVSLNNMFGYTDIEECIKYVGSKPASERKKCNKNDSRKMSDLEKEQFKNACNGVSTPDPSNPEKEENKEQEQTDENSELIEEENNTTQEIDETSSNES